MAPLAPEVSVACRGGMYDAPMPWAGLIWETAAAVEAESTARQGLLTF